MDIKVHINPQLDIWKLIIDRYSTKNIKIKQEVKSIINNVKCEGDLAIKNYAKKYDHCNLKNFLVSKKEILIANSKISYQLKKSIDIAFRNINSFHIKQLHKECKIQILSGVRCWRKFIPIEKIGLYIPGGSAPLFSTVLMLGIPSKIAGCKDVILCTPSNQYGEISPSILYTAQYIGINKIYKVGGAQAIAAMAIGTKSIPKVYKIFGPGNSYVTEAKKNVFQNGMVSIDMPAGPSEVAILADDTAVPEYVASDMLSQAEHDAESYILLVTINKLNWVEKVKQELNKQLEYIKVKCELIKESLRHSKIIVVSSLEIGIKIINQVAPEHLMICCQDSINLSNKITNAGSIFLGNYSPVSIGDYISGTNHVLPTNGYAKSYSGISVNSFMKTISFQQISKNGLETLSTAANIMAIEEGMIAHQKSINIRLNK
ncbi:histidinol dehydrogenase [Blattabacterium cuenoti]|uniref:histidinol dehydrogenase n=1 Tax=Blattabacterium cuenoti TaxID=1653831 RepID=UPI00163B752F|nr:histidinol dehydrogenase [Blattabacterium cuenoti]